jgi:hypothetical protein
MPNRTEKTRNTGASAPRVTAAPLPFPAGDGKNLAAQILGQMGGLKRAATMSPERRSEIAREAARKRWTKGSDE